MISTIFKFNDELYFDAISGHGYRKYCTHKYRPEGHDDSIDQNAYPGAVYFLPTHRLLEFYSLARNFKFPISIVTSYSDDSLTDCLPSSNLDSRKKI